MLSSRPTHMLVAHIILCLMLYVSPSSAESNKAKPSEPSAKENTNKRITQPRKVRKKSQPKRLSKARKLTPSIRNFQKRAKGKNIIEVYRTDEYVAIVELDKIPRHIVEWESGHLENLYVSTGRAPIVFFKGRVKPGYSISFEKRRIFLDKDGRFEFKYRVPLESTLAKFTIRTPFGYSYYQILNHWISLPPSLALTVREGKLLTRKSIGFSGEFKPSAFTQLYSGDTPIQQIDLDAQKHANMSFRVLSSIKENYDGWVLIIRNSKNKVVGKVGRFGTPPPFIDWREVGKDVIQRDVYSYQLNLFYEGQVFEGPVNHFETIEGFSLINHRYAPIINIEPTGGIGFYNFSDGTGEKHSGLTGNADVILTLWNRILFRGSGIFSVHDLDEQNLFTFTRIGAGIRYTGHGRSPFLGDPFILELNFFLNRTVYTLYPNAPVKRFSHYALLVDPKIVFSAIHSINPWFEFGARVAPIHRRISFGLNYSFYIRPWSISVIMGFAYDKLLQFGSGSSEAEFDVFQTKISGAFAL